MRRFSRPLFARACAVVAFAAALVGFESVMLAETCPNTGPNMCGCPALASYSKCASGVECPNSFYQKPTDGAFCCIVAANYQCTPGTSVQMVLCYTQYKCKVSSINPDYCVTNAVDDQIFQAIPNTGLACPPGGG